MNEDAFDLPSKSSGSDRRGLELFGLKENLWMLPVGGAVASTLLFTLLMLQGMGSWRIGIAFALAPLVIMTGYTAIFFRASLPPNFHSDWWAGVLHRDGETNPRPRRAAMARSHPRLNTKTRPHARIARFAGWLFPTR